MNVNSYKQLNTKNRIFIHKLYTGTNESLKLVIL
jgi:hypothetical protein